jgi:isomaltose glucohydrolase
LTELFSRSVEVIKEGQAASGAYYACPTFENYRYCWFRDGSFIADAMSRVGEVESAERFYDWCADVVARHYPDLHARYTVDGEPTGVEWATDQLDGYGAWVWSMHAHARRHDRRTTRWDESADLSLQYVSDRWGEPTTDWWEEQDGIHAATLACAYGGLASRNHPLAPVVGAAAVAHAGDRLDASLLCLYQPFGLLSGTVTLSRIEHQLVDPDGGVHRHLDDEYYGGGAWIILVAWLGWARPERARECLAWIEARATPEGHLPEQVAEHLLFPGRLEPWNEKWGTSACPLLWSHAMYLTLASELQRP